MSLILNLETATTNCSVALAKDGEVIALKEYNSANYSHAEQLHVFIGEVMEMANVSLNQIDAIAVSKGPGSYTGLRIGVSAAKGLCYALDKKLISIPTLESMAQQVTDDYDFIISLLDARRMEVYAQVFSGKKEILSKTAAEIIDENSFQDYTPKGKTILIGSGAEKCKDVLLGDIAYDTTVIPSAREMATLSYVKFNKGIFEDVAYFEPFYLKDFMVMQKKVKN